LDQQQTKGSEPVGVLRWEFNALVLESVLLGAGLLALLSVMGRRLLAPAFPMASPVAQGVGLLLLMLALYPVLSIHLRSVHGRRVGFGKMLAWSVLGSAVGGLLFAVLQGLN
jgi:hypothetical protein